MSNIKGTLTIDLDENGVREVLAAYVRSLGMSDTKLPKIVFLTTRDNFGARIEIELPDEKFNPSKRR